MSRIIITVTIKIYFTYFHLWLYKLHNGFLNVYKQGISCNIQYFSILKFTHSHIHGFFYSFFGMFFFLAFSLTRQSVPQVFKLLSVREENGLEQAVVVGPPSSSLQRRMLCTRLGSVQIFLPAGFFNSTLNSLRCMTKNEQFFLIACSSYVHKAELKLVMQGGCLLIAHKKSFLLVVFFFFFSFSLILQL